LRIVWFWIKVQKYTGFLGELENDIAMATYILFSCKSKAGIKVIEKHYERPSNHRASLLLTWRKPKTMMCRGFGRPAIIYENAIFSTPRALREIASKEHCTVVVDFVVITNDSHSSKFLRGLQEICLGKLFPVFLPVVDFVGHNQQFLQQESQIPHSPSRFTENVLYITV
jgi:hypothetical protein